MTDLNFPNAVSSERDFFGRLDCLAQIMHVLLSRKRVPIFVVGERRIGKTSLQNVAIEQVTAKAPAQFQVYHIEPRGIASYAQFTQALLRRVMGWAGGSGGGSGSGQSAGGQSAGGNGSSGAHIPQTGASVVEFEAALSGVLERQNQEIIICIDEFDEIVHRMGDDLPNLLGTFYDLVEKTALPVYFFFTMTNVPAEMKTERASTLVSVSHIIELKPLSAAEMRCMAQRLTQDRLEWQPEALEGLFHYSGGHPYFTKLLLSCLLEDAPEERVTAVTLERLGRAVGRAAQDTGAGYALENLYRMQFSAEEKEIMLYLARQCGDMPLEALERAGLHWATTAKRLVKRHYLRVDERTGCLEFQIALFAEWLRCWIEFDLECEQYTRLRKDLAPTERPVIEVDGALKCVRVSGEQVHLSKQEYKIMLCLAEKAGLLITKYDLSMAAWDTTEGVTDQTIDNAVCRLRKKLGSSGHLIETRPGQGYVLHQAVLLVGQR